MQILKRAMTSSMLIVDGSPWSLNLTVTCNGMSHAHYLEFHINQHAKFIWLVAL
jgi:hypothetical protein